MLIFRRASPSIRLLVAIVMVAAVYAFALQDRLHDHPRAFSGFGFYPQAILAASASTRLHVAAGAAAVLLGLLQLALAKGTPRHRAMGYAWIATMLALCISALFMKDRFGLLQMLALVVIGLMARAVWLVRRQDIAGHAHTMRVLVLGATVGVGLFTALPGRVTWSLFFSG
jgi:uncharacterized membrane protein